MIFRSRRLIMGSICQILLGILIFPLLCLILAWLSPDKGASFILNIFSGIELFEIWPDVVVSMAQGANFDNVVNYLDVLNIAVGGTVIETTVIGLSIFLCKNIGGALHVRGIPVLQTLLGSFLGCIISKAIDVSSLGYLLLSLTFLLLANYVVLIIFFRGQTIKKILSGLIGPGVSVMIAGMAAAFVTANLLILKGQVHSFGTGMALILGTFTPLLALLLVDYFLLTPKK